MKAVRKLGKGKENMVLVEVPEPTMGPEDVLLEVGACGICGSDLHIRVEEHEYRAPVTVGHEYAGVIIDKGLDVDSKWKLGDHVAGDLETMNGRIGVHVDGGYAERMVVPQQLLHRMPKGMSMAEGAMVELVTCMSHSLIHRSRICPGDFVVILGPGPIGLTMLQMVKLYSPRELMVTGLKDDKIRLAKAAELGADHTHCSEDDPVKAVMDLTNGQGADLVIDCTGGDEAIGQAVQMAKNGGWITIIGVWGKNLTLNLDNIPYKNLTVRGGWGWGGMEVDDQAVRMAAGWHSWERALTILGMGKDKIDMTSIITDHIRLQDWEDAFARLEAKQEIKVVIYPNEKYMPRDARPRT